jgi:hypothetical protein
MLQVRIIDHDRQEPSLETRMRAWRNARLPQRLEAAKPVLPDLFDVRAWQRSSRRVRTQEILRRVPRRGTANVALALGVTSRAVNYWRCGAVAPTPRHWRQLTALCDLVVTTKHYCSTV